MSETIVTKGRTILPSKPYSGTVQQGIATRKTPVNIAEIIEQVRALKRHDEWNYTYGAGFNRGIDSAIEILERHL